MFTEQYYLERMEAAIRQTEHSRSENDRKFYSDLANRWAALLPSEKRDLLQVKEPIQPSKLSTETPADAAKRLSDKRVDWRFRYG
jgi:hypothetical protein